MKAVVLGGGFAGTTVAHLLARGGAQVTLLEREQYLGGGCRTFFHAGHPFTYGPRVYYGYSKKAHDWLAQFCPIRRFPFELRTLAHEPVDAARRFWSYPPHERDLADYPRAEQIAQELDALKAGMIWCADGKAPADFEEYWRQKVGPTIYDMFVDHYSKKMWMIGDNRVFDIFKWSAKDRPMESGTREAYKGSILGYPVARDGYNAYFDAMVKGVDVRLGRTARIVPSVKSEGGAPVVACKEDDHEIFEADVVVSTIPIDELCGEEGALPYVGREFHLVVLPCAQVFPGDVRFCHYASPRDEWTRITEFKKLTYHESPDTLLVLERPSRVNKLYPYLTKANEAKVAAYMTQLPAGVHSIGRLGTYKYSTIEQTIVQAFACAARILGTPMPEGIEAEWRGIGDTSMMAKDRKEG